MLALPDLATRRLEPELMDDPALEPALHEQALRGLARLNAAGGAARMLFGPLGELAAQGPLRVLDIACGAGDLGCALAERARRSGLSIVVDGADRSPFALEHARTRARAAGLEPRFYALDALRDELPADYDLLTASLFLHHLETEQAELLLARMAHAARRAILVLDLARSRASYLLAWSASRLLTRSRVVRADAPRSVAAAFTLDEARALAARAGLAGARVDARPPARWLLRWKRATS